MLLVRRCRGLTEEKYLVDSVINTDGWRGYNGL